MRDEILSGCEFHKDNRDLIEEAGRMVGIDLKNPIDLSQMHVYNITSEAAPTDDPYPRMEMIHKAILFANVTNEHNEQEKLTIIFELKSARAPKRKEL